MTRIGFLGLGRMGVLMADRLVAAGHEVTGWNRTPGKEFSGTVAQTAAEAVAGKELVITMLSDPEAVRAVLEGISDHLDQGALVVEMSTIGPEAVAEARAKLRDDVRLVDAPVIGSLPQAGNGELKIFAGGAAEDVDAAREELAVLGTVQHVGPLGDGAAIKLVLNISTITTMVMLGESLALADRLGLDQESTLDALGGTAVGAFVTRIRPRIGNPDTPTNFALGLAEKDLRLALESGLGDGLVAAARDRLAAAGANGSADADLSAVISSIRDTPAR